MSRIDEIKRLYAAQGEDLSEREAVLVYQAWRSAEGVSREATREALTRGRHQGALVCALVLGWAALLLMAVY